MLVGDHVSYNWRILWTSEQQDATACWMIIVTRKNMFQRTSCRHQATGRPKMWQTSKSWRSLWPQSTCHCCLNIGDVPQGARYKVMSHQYITLVFFPARASSGFARNERWDVTILQQSSRIPFCPKFNKLQVQQADPELIRGFGNSPSAKRSSAAARTGRSLGPLANKGTGPRMFVALVPDSCLGGTRWASNDSPTPPE